MTNASPKMDTPPLAGSVANPTDSKSPAVNHKSQESARRPTVLKLTLSPLQALRFRAFLDEAKKRDCATGLLATVAPRQDAASGKTTLELRIAAVSRETASKVQRLVHEETKEGRA